MFAKWALFFIGLSIMCPASASYRNITILDPFLTYFQKCFKKPTSLSFKSLYYDEIKTFIQQSERPQLTALNYKEYQLNKAKATKLHFSVSNSWAFGPKGGLLTSYLLATNLQILGKAAKNFVLTKISSDNDLINAQQLKESFLKQTTTDFGLGVGYTSNISKMHLTLRAFYDFHVISDWEAIIQKAQLTNKKNISFEDFYFHGLSGTLKFDF